VGAPAHLRAVKKKFLGVIYGKICKCTPKAEQFMTFLLGGGDLEAYLVVLVRLLRAMTKKRSSTFFRKKFPPQTESGLRLCLYSLNMVQLVALCVIFLVPDSLRSVVLVATA